MAHFARYMIEKLRHQCEAALMSGVLVTKENMFPVFSCFKILLLFSSYVFQLARVAMEYSCFSRPAETILAKCARFLKIEITRNFGILKLLSKDDYEIFQVWLHLDYQCDSCEILNWFPLNSIFTFAVY